jgi:hypothetical protein
MRQAGERELITAPGTLEGKERDYLEELSTDRVTTL